MYLPPHPHPHPHPRRHFEFPHSFLRKTGPGTPMSQTCKGLTKCVFCGGGPTQQRAFGGGGRGFLGCLGCLWML